MGRNTYEFGYRFCVKPGDPSPDLIQVADFELISVFHEPDLVLSGK
jgi:hypothetical protein